MTKMPRPASISKEKKNEVRSPPFIAELRSLVRSRDLEITDDFVFRIVRLEAAEDQRPICEIDLNHYVLPPNGVYSFSTPLVTRSDLVAALALVVDEYLLTTDVKTRTSSVRKIVQASVFFFEFMWLHDTLHLTSVTPSLTNELKNLLLGGWPNALRLGERLLAAPRDQVLVALKTQKEGGPGRHALRGLIHTNCDRWILVNKNSIRRQLADGDDVIEAKVDLKSGTYSESLGILNRLAKIEPQFALPFFPYSKIGMLKGTNTSGRTRNLDLSIAVRILVASMEWIYVIGPRIIQIIRSLCDDGKQKIAQEAKLVGFKFKTLIDLHPAVAEIRSLAGINVANLDICQDKDKSVSVRAMITALITACFCAIAIMNARRKDEVIHRKIGLRQGDLTVVDEDLELYVVNFYIEKSFRDRLPYYVNTATKDAILLLQELGLQHDHFLQQYLGNDFTKIERQSLFLYPRLSNRHGFSPKRSTYVFAYRERTNDAGFFLKYAVGDSFNSVASHMFRRAYCLIMFYRYENADLQSLALQLGTNLLTPLIYLTDSSMRPDFETIPFKIRKSMNELKGAYLAQAKELNDEYSEVGYKKMFDDICAVFSNGKFFGGYEKYLRRIGTKLTNMIDFSGTNLLDKEKMIFEVVKKRGHFPAPYPHGQCMAGGALSVKSAKCHSKQDKKLHRELASPERCTGCIFNLSSDDYIRNLEGNIASMEDALKALPSGSLLRSRAEDDIHGLVRAVALMKERRNP